MAGNGEAVATMLKGSAEKGSAVKGSAAAVGQGGAATAT